MKKASGGVSSQLLAVFSLSFFHIHSVLLISYLFVVTVKYLLIPFAVIDTF